MLTITPWDPGCKSLCVNCVSSVRAVNCVTKIWARPGFEPGTSRTLSENHTPRPTSQVKVIHPSGTIRTGQLARSHALLSVKKENVSGRVRTGDLVRVKHT